MKIQHTPTPWEIDGAYIVKRSELKGADDTVIARVDFTVPGFRKGDKEMIVRAVNSYEEDQKTIFLQDRQILKNIMERKALLEAAKAVLNQIGLPKGIDDLAPFRSLRKAIAQAEGRP